MSSIVAQVVLASDQRIPSADNEVWMYAIAGVALFVVGCLLTILADARRAASGRTPRREQDLIVDDGRRSPAVTRLQHDVRGWLKRTS